MFHSSISGEKTIRILKAILRAPTHVGLGQSPPCYRLAVRQRHTGETKHVVKPVINLRFWRMYAHILIYKYVYIYIVKFGDGLWWDLPHEFPDSVSGKNMKKQLSQWSTNWITATTGQGSLVDLLWNPGNSPIFNGIIEPAPKITQNMLMWLEYCRDLPGRNSTFDCELFELLKSRCSI